MKKEDCWEDFRERLSQALGACEELPDDWVAMATVIRQTGREVFGVSSEQRTDDKETCCWIKEVQESI